MKKPCFSSIIPAKLMEKGRQLRPTKRCEELRAMKLRKSFINFGLFIDACYERMQKFDSTRLRAR
jgi:hypothetical protein